MEARDGTCMRYLGEREPERKMRLGRRDPMALAVVVAEAYTPATSIYRHIHQYLGR
jgi:hypothetical protein